MIDRVVDYKATGATGVENAVVCVFNTRTIEVGGRECSCVKGSPEDGFAFAVCALMDYSIVDVEIADIFGDTRSVVSTDEGEGVVTGVAGIISHPLAPWMISLSFLGLRGGVSHPCWVSGATEEGRWGVINGLFILFLHVWVDDISEDRDVAEV